MREIGANIYFQVIGSKIYFKKDWKEYLILSSLFIPLSGSPRGHAKYSIFPKITLRNKLG